MVAVVERAQRATMPAADKGSAIKWGQCGQWYERANTGTTQRVGATATRRARKGERGGNEASVMSWEQQGRNDVVDAGAMKMTGGGDVVNEASVTYSSQNPATRYAFTISAVDGNNDVAPYGNIVHPDGKNGKSKRMVEE